ncbi:proline--tRNA ligase [candidate division Kazan bacterium]|uniref:Proline--tRNA ligase n=1 Tax=candidate division Kazan bacterium TaxID=2202143 RepID=A0A420ZDA7_UNCK3|nr:MAG: proline--tRNA ligase [candidate division Kazan bacterium]
MRYSKSFTKTTKEKPKEVELVSHEYLLRSGFITPLGAGFYTYLPLGFRVLKKIRNIIEEELANIGVEEMSMPVVQPARIWKESGRWLEVGPELWKFQNRSEEDFALAMTHEEAVTDAAKQIIFSYKDLPKIVNQIQIKVRDEARPRGGLLRLREFLMQDGYSFDKDEAGLDKSYNLFMEAYKKIFARVGIKTAIIESDTGAMGGSGAHEFMMIAKSGEDKIISDGKRTVNAEKVGIAREEDIDSAPARAKIKEFFGHNNVEFMRGIEVGNIFKLGTKYSTSMKLQYVDEKNKLHPVVMGSYGIGLDRLIASIVEASHDDKGIIWPASVAPYRVHLIHLGDNYKVIDAATKIYDELWAAGIETFYDDRDEASAGDKLNDADLIGLPYRLVVSEKTIAKNSAEIKARDKKTASNIKLDEVVKTLRE